jgi:hypothetical protein
MAVNSVKDLGTNAIRFILADMTAKAFTSYGLLVSG